MGESIENTPVLIVGGSLVGLSTAMFLGAQSQHPICPIVIERHDSYSIHPRAFGYTPRTIEIFRGAGIADKIPASNQAFYEVRRAKVDSLAGKWYEETSWTPKEVKSKDKKGEEGNFSPTNGAAIAQDTLEPILRTRVTELGADIRFGTKLLSFEQDADGVNAKVVDSSGKKYTIRAQNMIAADGGRSRIREALGIKRTGRHIQTKRSVLFRANLEQYLQKGVVQFTIDQLQGLKNIFMTTYDDGRWVLMWDDEDDTPLEETELRRCIEAAIGRTDIPIEIITTGRWEINGLIAEKFRSGRVFLAGDAAHTLPPSRGGYGANTGIHDGHNLAWKLASVIAGVSKPSLLDTYEEERRPVALLRYQQLFSRSDYLDQEKENVSILEDSAVEFGQLYRSGAVLGAGDELPIAQRPDLWKGQPGTRAPHLNVSKNGQTVSSIDLFGFNWTLVAEDEHWTAAVADAEQATGIKIDLVRIGKDVAFPSQNTFPKAFGVGISGASLVRPDGYIAWRMPQASTCSAEDLTEALLRISSSMKENTKEKRFSLKCDLSN